MHCVWGWSSMVLDISSGPIVPGCALAAAAACSSFGLSRACFAGLFLMSVLVMRVGSSSCARQDSVTLMSLLSGTVRRAVFKVEHAGFNAEISKS